MGAQHICWIRVKPTLDFTLFLPFKRLHIPRSPLFSKLPCSLSNSKDCLNDMKLIDIHWIDLKYVTSYPTNVQKNPIVLLGFHLYLIKSPEAIKETNPHLIRRLGHSVCADGVAALRTRQLLSGLQTQPVWVSQTHLLLCLIVANSGFGILITKY